MKTTIDVEDFLSESEMKHIAREVFENRLNQKMQEKGDIERIITNSAYSVVWSAIEDSFDEDAVVKLSDKVKELLSDMELFNVFQKPTAWDRSSNYPYDVLVQSVKDNKNLLDNVIQEGMMSLTKKQKSELALEVAKHSLK